MIGFWRQLRFLLWKGTVIKRRQKFWLSVELIVPLLLFAILAEVRTRNFTDSRTQCHYDSKGFPSAGFLPFLHSFLCSFSNTCHLSPTTGDETLIINNGTGQNESMVIDVLYYSSLQLERIGKNPTEFATILSEFSYIVKILAAVNGSAVTPFVFKELFLPSYDLSHQLRTLGLSHNLAETIAQSRVMLPLFIESYKWANSLLSLPTTFESSQVIEGIPFLCDRNLFQASFLLPSNTTLDKDSTSSLCGISPIKLLLFDYEKMLKNINKQPNKVLPLLNGSSIHMDHLSIPISHLTTLLESQPLTKVFWKWSHLLFGSSSIKEAVFCGSDPFKTSSEGLNPGFSTVKTPFDEMKNELINFIERIIPGKVEHDKQFCQNIPIHDDLNCSSLEIAALRKLRPLLQGYILVTPPSPIVNKLINILNQPLRHFDFFRSLLYEYVEVADKFQDELFLSDIYKASSNLLAYIRASHPIPYPSPLINRLEFVLEHYFSSSSDPYSFGALSKNIVEIINQYTTCILSDRFIPVPSESDMEEIAVCLTNYQQYFSGIVFINMTDNATSFEDFTTYKIRHQPGLVDGTYAIDDSSKRKFDRNKPFSDLKYLTYGFSFLQEAVDHAIIMIKTNTSFKLGMYSQQEPYPCAENDDFNISNLFGLFVILSFIIPTALLVKNIVHEKEQRLKEQMRIMGLGDTIHFVSWAIISFVLNLFSIIVISFILKFGKLFDHTDLSLIIVFLLLFSLSSIALSLLLSTFFTNANISTAATCLVSFLFFFPYQLSVKSKNKVFSQFTLVFPQTTLGYGTAMLAQNNDLQKATWSDINQIYLSAYDISLSQCFVAFSCQTVAFSFIAWYISAIAPGAYGVSRPWYFFLSRSYWFPSLFSINQNNLEETFDSSSINYNFEQETKSQKMTVQIMNISKIYLDGTQALDKINLCFYETQITALLGHNGAGKTTIMSILCGLYAPSSGTALVYGKDIKKDLQGVRDTLGFCPQYNVLFELLSVSEQLRFFAALKGIRDEQLDKEVLDTMESISLLDKAHCLANTLSGGMKRRLCIGIALIGGSRFIIMDEPTAGVDVNSRKEIWKVLQQNKNGRTILLSTHHMDEADVLSDRIAIISEGKLLTAGSSIFLKTRYGNCFQLIACKKESSFDYRSAVTRIIAEVNIPLKLSDETDEELFFSIPISINSFDLEIFFQYLDKHLDQFKIRDYGISSPTLQEIFISITPHREYIVPKRKAGFLRRIKKSLEKRIDMNTEQVVLMNDRGRNTSDNSDTKSIGPEEFEPSPILLNGWLRRLSHMIALLECRLHYFRRNKKAILFEIMLPIALLFACELYSKMQNIDSQVMLTISQSPLPLVQSLFGNDTDSYVSLWDRTPSSYSYHIMESFVEPPGMGTRCVSGVPSLETASGCAYGSSSGTFNFDFNGSIAYNADLICECMDNLGWNCTQENYPLPSLSSFTLNTTERVWDLSFRNISQMRMATRNSVNKTLDSPFFMGGFSLGHKNFRARNSNQINTAKKGWIELLEGAYLTAERVNLNLTSVRPSTLPLFNPFDLNMTIDQFVGDVLSNMDTKENVKVWFNNKLWPSLPIYASILSNGLLRVQMQDTDVTSIGILTINHPMNTTVRDTFDMTEWQKLIVFRITIIVLALCIIPASFTVFLVEDRVSDSYHLQIVSGLSKNIYWLTGYLFDMTVYTLSIILILLIYIMLGVREITYSVATFLSFFLLFWIYGFSATLWNYILQRFFRVPALSFVMIAMGTFFLGIVGSLTIIIIEEMMKRDPTLKTSHTICSYLFLILPQYNLGMAMFRGSFVYQLVQIGESYLTDLNRPDLVHALPIPYVLEWDLMGIHCIILLFHILFAAIILMLVEHKSIGFLRRKEIEYTKRLLEEDSKEEDVDVIKEQRRIEAIENMEGAPLIVKRLAKAYSPSHLAVRGISFGVEKGECFGLLGMNGAGKTSMFAMLTGKFHAGNGLVSVYGFPVSPDDSSAFAQVGYCPQFDALHMKLTTKENLVFYARIRGIPKKNIDELVNHLMVSLHLRPYSSTLTASLSGGNRRKLSVAIALISHPPLILLDEPSAGMDPISQQFLWEVVDRLRRSGKSVIITSHSMEECEVLCTRIAIMDKGKIRCLGSKQHLKNKFGEGYSLTIKITSSSDVSRASDFILTQIQGAKLESIHCSTIFIQICRGISSISRILNVINQLKTTMSIEDFSLSQSTLNDVFQSLSSKKWCSSDSNASSNTLSTQNTEVSD